MTGFGSASINNSKYNIEILIRSVNNRFLDIRYHIPKEYLYLETNLKQLIKKYISRASLDIHIYRKKVPENNQIIFNYELVEKLLKFHKDISTKFKIPLDFHLSQIISQNSNIINIEDNPEISLIEEKLLLNTFIKALKNCSKQRYYEGSILKKNLIKLASNLKKEIISISQLKEKSRSLLIKNFHNKIEQLKLKNKIDPQRIHQEITILLEKYDFTEEIARLFAHLLTFQKIIKTPQIKGKKLDFYTQELLREVNTIGSKANVELITQKVVEAKTIIEQIREQVQNIE